MNSPYFILAITILILLLITLGLIYFSYWLPKKFGKRNLGLWISRGLSAVVISILILIIFGDKLYSKSNANQRLGEHGMELKQDFVIITNKSGGFEDYYHEFVLRISPEDKERLIDKIVTSKTYQGFYGDFYDIREGKTRYSDRDTIFVINYQDRFSYIYEFFETTDGYTPTWDKISISKEENILKYERFLD